MKLVHEELVRISIWYEEHKNPMEVQRLFYARFDKDKALLCDSVIG